MRENTTSHDASDDGRDTPFRERRSGHGERRRPSALAIASADPALDGDAFARLLSAEGVQISLGALRPLLDRLLSDAAAVLAVDVALVRRLDPNGDRLVLHGVQGVVAPGEIPEIAERGSLPCARVLETREPVATDVLPQRAGLADAAADVAYQDRDRAPLRSAYTVPIVAEGELLGCLTLYRRTRWEPSPAERRIVDLLVERLVQGATVRRLADAARAELAAREATAEALRIAELRFRRLMEANVIGIAVAGMDGVREANDEYLRHAGYSRADLQAGRVDWQAVTPPEYLAHDRKALEELLATGAATPFEKEYLHGDGTRVRMLVGASRLTRHPPTWIAFTLDVSELREREQHATLLAAMSEALAASLDFDETLERVTRLVVPALADWCLVDLAEEPAADGARAIRRVAGVHGDPSRQPLVAALFAYPPDASRRNVVYRAIESGEPQVLASMDEAELERGAVDAEHARLTRELDARSVVVMPLSAHARVRGAMTFVRGGARPPFTPRDLPVLGEASARAAIALSHAALYREATTANRVKGDFLAVMSHELRTPLNAILGYTALLADGVSGPVGEEQRRQLGRVRAAAHHLLSLIDEVLTLSRLEAGHERLFIEDVDVREIVAEVVAMVEQSAEHRGLALHRTVPDRPVRLACDAVRLRQVLLNLVSNAIKFTEHGTVSLVLEERAREVRIAISDTGVGIAPEHIAHVFDSFWRADHSPTRRTTGSGLGLAISRRLMMLMQGELAVESAPGHGSTFTVTLPRASSLGE